MNYGAALGAARRVHASPPGTAGPGPTAVVGYDGSDTARAAFVRAPARARRAMSTSCLHYHLPSGVVRFHCPRQDEGIQTTRLKPAGRDDIDKPAQQVRASGS